ncbi:MAG: hypothetical protein KY445_11565, partial [Armatimonadetes bacterium]|nr:hypothetical protein [Armatimonadota bacterium]
MLPPLKIWTDFSFEKWSSGMGFVDLLIPLRGQSTTERNEEINISKGRFDEYERKGDQLFTL